MGKKDNFEYEKNLLGYFHKAMADIQAEKEPKPVDYGLEVNYSALTGKYVDIEFGVESMFNNKSQCGGIVLGLNGNTLSLKEEFGGETSTIYIDTRPISFIRVRD